MYNIEIHTQVHFKLHKNIEEKKQKHVHKALLSLERGCLLVNH